MFNLFFSLKLPLLPLYSRKIFVPLTPDNQINNDIMSDNNKNQLQIELPREVAQGEYANFAIITHSSSDFVIDFARVLPGVPKAQVKSRVILAPEHAKRLLGALQENITRYEREFGSIKIPQQEPRTIAPFPTGKGEA